VNEVRRPGFVKDAESAGRYAMHHAKSLPKARSRMTASDFDVVAHWAARCAGHWGRLALGHDNLDEGGQC
jgi:hypothetical protein